MNQYVLIVVFLILLSKRRWDTQGLPLDLATAGKKKERIEFLQTKKYRTGWESDPGDCIVSLQSSRKRGQSQSDYSNATVPPLLVVPLEIAANTLVEDTHPVSKKMRRVSCIRVFGFGV